MMDVFSSWSIVQHQICHLNHTVRDNVNHTVRGLTGLVLHAITLRRVYENGGTYRPGTNIYIYIVYIIFVYIF